MYRSVVCLSRRLFTDAVSDVNTKKYKIRWVGDDRQQQKSMQTTQHTANILCYGKVKGFPWICSYFLVYKSGDNLRPVILQ